MRSARISEEGPDDTTQQNAARLLREADRAGTAAERRAPNESLLFIGWKLFNAVVIPGFDFFDRRMWGWGPSLDDLTTFSYTLAGLVAAAPLLFWGLHLRRGA